MEVLLTLWAIPVVKQIGTTVLIGAMYTYILNQMSDKIKNKKRKVD